MADRYLLDLRERVKVRRTNPRKIQALLEAGEQQLDPEDFNQLKLLLSDLEVYGLTPWINAELGKLMAKIEWEPEIEQSPEWQPALQACDYAFSGEELKRMCSAAGVGTGGHKKELCERLYHAGVLEVVEVMAPYLGKDIGATLALSNPHANPMNQTKRVYVDKTRNVIDRLEELHRSDPEEFYRRKKIIRQAIEERVKGKKVKTMPDFTLEELQDILKEADMLYR